MYKTAHGCPVSVIVPAYNHEEYVVRALDSIFAQSYQPLELVVIDDQSKDATLSIISQWLARAAVQKRFSRITLLRNEKNIGAHATINCGVEASSSDLFTVLNSDDAFAAQRIDLLVEAMTKSGAGFSFSKVNCIDAEDNIIPESELPKDLLESFAAADKVSLTYPSLSFGFLESNLAISTGNMVIHRTLFDKLGGFRALKYIHDWDFAIRAILETEPAYVSRCLYHYRLHGTNSFRTLSGVKDIEIEAMADHFSALLVALGQVPNKLAPTPQNWPYVFDAYVATFYLLTWNRFARERSALLEKALEFEIEARSMCDILLAEEK